MLIILGMQPELKRSAHDVSIGTVPKLIMLCIGGHVEWTMGFAFYWNKSQPDNLCHLHAVVNCIYKDLNKVIWSLNYNVPVRINCQRAVIVGKNNLWFNCVYFLKQFIQK